ncbi:MAG: MASE3 domain-containing protein [Candidatus Thorarchaeota archaeon]
MTREESIYYPNNKDSENKLNSSGIAISWIEIGSFSIILIVIFLTSLFNYLLFHSLAEILSIMIAGGIFLIGWNSRKYTDDSYFLILGVSALFVAIFDIIHTLSYEGLSIFPEHGANLSTQLWIAGRYILAFSFLFATVMRSKKIPQNILILSYSIISLILILLIFLKLFPICFVEGKGLTLFKIVSEYVVIVIFIITLLITYKLKFEFTKQIYNFIVLTLIFFIFSEFAFTLYHDVFGPMNEIGHILKIVAFLLLYKVIVLVGFNQPVDILFKELKSSKEKIRESATLYFNLFENSPISVWEADFSNVKNYIDNLRSKGINKIIEYLNKNKGDLLKCVSMIKILDTNKATLDMYKASNKEDFYIGLQKTFTEEGLNAFKYEIYGSPNIEKFVDFETTIRTLKNDEKNVLMRILIEPGYEDTWSRVIVNTIDITSRVRAEKHLEEFVTSVSHELKTPITVLKQSLFNLNKYKENLNDALKSDLFNAIVRNTNLLSELIEDILIISKIDENYLILELEEISIYNIFLDLMKSMEPKIKTKNLDIKLSIDEELKLTVDPKRFSQIFRIFIDNAIKYSNNNSSIEILAFDNYNEKYNPTKVDGILLQIIDKGIGIKENDKQNLFKRFFRSKDVGDISGTGLGLPIAEKLIKLHGGHVFIDSEFGIGTTISVFFPKGNS